VTLALAAPGRADNLLTDGGFENGADVNSFDPAWSQYGHVFHEPVTPRSGIHTAKLFGNFTGEENYSGIFQDALATPGLSYRAEAFMRHNANDRLAGMNEAFVQLEFRDPNGNVLATHKSTSITPATDTERYELYTTGNVTAPEGAATARFSIVFRQSSDGQPGAVFCDEAALTIESP
jgi:hypothetical protein